MSNLEKKRDLLPQRTTISSRQRRRTKKNDTKNKMKKKEGRMVAGEHPAP